jgi:hypothetical protein
MIDINSKTCIRLVSYVKALAVLLPASTIGWAKKVDLVR